LLRPQGLEQVSYQRLPDKWRIGPNEVHPFLLKVRQVNKPGRS
jgi:hypothetical protein